MGKEMDSGGWHAFDGVMVFGRRWRELCIKNQALNLLALITLSEPDGVNGISGRSIV